MDRSRFKHHRPALVPSQRSTVPVAPRRAAELLHPVWQVSSAPATLEAAVMVQPAELVLLSAQKLLHTRSRQLKHLARRKFQRVVKSSRRFAKRTQAGLVAGLQGLNRSLSRPVKVASLLMMVAVMVVPLYLLNRINAYWLTPQASALLSPMPQDVQSYFHYNSKQQSYSINYTTQTAIASGGVGLNGQPLTATLPRNLAQGAQLTNPETQLGIALTPTFSTDLGKLVNGHVVYPVQNLNAQLVYTFKDNGIKEDILLNSAPGKTASFAYNLQVPSDLDARLLPNGDLGIYGVNSLLYGNINYGTATDEQKIEAARQNGTKDNLLFVIPKPTVVQHGNGVAPHAYFSYRNSVLTVHVSGLDKASYPLSVDPSMALASVNPFASGGSEDGSITYATSTQISRPGTTGGTITSWTTDSGKVLSTARGGSCTVAYNNRLYVLGGNANNTYYNDVQSTSFTSPFDGSLSGSFSTTGLATFTTARGYFGCAIFSNYLFIAGGYSGSGQLNDVQMAKININDGSIGSWTSLGTFNATGREAIGMAIVNNYLYIIGGFDGTNVKNDGYVASINPSGSLGSFSAISNNFSTARAGMALAVWDQNLYIVGGCGSYASRSCTSVRSDVQYARSLSDGSLSTWTAATSLPANRAFEAAYVSGGYLYAAGGYDGSSFQTSAHFANLNSDGSLGLWYSTTVLSAARGNPAYIPYNGYLYAVGGCTSGACNGVGNQLATTTYAKIDAMGTLDGVSTLSGTSPTGSFPTARWGAAVATYDSYIYAAGGCSNTETNCNSTTGLLTDTIYAKLNTDGTIGDCGSGAGKWCDDTTDQLTGSSVLCTGNNGGVFDASAVAYKGFLYVAGGSGTSGLFCNSTTDVNVVQDIQLGSIDDGGGAPSGGWTRSGTFAGNGTGVAVVQWQGDLYVLGGSSEHATIGNNVRWSAISTTTGTPGAFTTTTGMPAGLDELGAVIVNGYMYAIGGDTANTTSSAHVYHVQLPATGGNLTASWTSAGTDTDLPAARERMTVAAVDGKIYVAGGSSWVAGVLTPQSTVYYATPNSSTGNISSWTTVSSALSTPRGGARGAYINGFLYIPGGFSANSYGTLRATTDYLPINNGGPGVGLNDIPSSGGGTLTYNTARIYPAITALNGYLYVIGGCSSYSTDGNNTCLSFLTSVEYAKIQADGTLSSTVCGHTTTFCVATHGLNTGRVDPRVAAWSGYLYVMAGTISTGTSTNAEYVVPSASTGDIGSAWTTTTTITQPTFTSNVAQFGRYLYALRSTTQTSVFLTLPLSGGDFSGGWTATAGGAVKVSSSNASLVTSGNYLYKVGGDNGTAPFSTVEDAAITQSSGDLGAWNTTTSLPLEASGVDTYIQNGYIHAYAGRNLGDTPFTSGCYTHDWAAPILPSGGVGTWISGPSTDISNISARSVTYNGFAYQASGGCGTNFNTWITSSGGTVYVSKTESAPRLARFSRLFDTDFDTTPINYIMNSSAGGNTRFITSGQNSDTATNSFNSALSVLDGAKLASLYTWAAGNTSQQARYYWLNFTIDESGSAYIDDSNGANITSLFLYYHAYTPKRLRNGKTFTDQLQQSLDAHP